MRDYMIKATKYNEKGAETNDYQIRYADNASDAENICYEFSKQTQEGVDNNGEPKTMKLYKVELFIQTYELCEDRDSFFANFK